MSASSGRFEHAHLEGPLKARIIVRLVVHAVVLLSIAAFPILFPEFLRRIAQPGNALACSTSLDCLIFNGFWAAALVGLVVLVLDIGLLRRRTAREGWLWASLSLEFLLTVGWYVGLSGLRNAAVVGAAWLVIPGPAIMLSAVVSAAAAWWQTGESAALQPDAARLWSQRTIAIVLSLVALLFIYIYIDLLLFQ